MSSSEASCTSTRPSVDGDRQRRARARRAGAAAKRAGNGPAERSATQLPRDAEADEVHVGVGGLVARADSAPGPRRRPRDRRPAPRAHGAGLRSRPRCAACCASTCQARGRGGRLAAGPGVAAVEARELGVGQGAAVLDGVRAAAAARSSPGARSPGPSRTSSTRAWTTQARRIRCERAGGSGASAWCVSSARPRCKRERRAPRWTGRRRPRHVLVAEHGRSARPLAHG